MAFIIGFRNSKDLKGEGNDALEMLKWTLNATYAAYANFNKVTPKLTPAPFHAQASPPVFLLLPSHPLHTPPANSHPPHT